MSSKYVPPSARKQIKTPEKIELTSLDAFPVLGLSPKTPSRFDQAVLDYKKAAETKASSVYKGESVVVLASHPLTSVKVIEMTNQQLREAKSKTMDSWDAEVDEACIVVQIPEYETFCYDDQEDNGDAGYYNYQTSWLSPDDGNDSIEVDPLNEVVVDSMDQIEW